MTIRCIHRLLAAAMLLLGAGCSPSPREHSGELTVFAAASLTEAFTEAAKVFERSHPGVTVHLSFAASTALMAQIEAGAPADVFASARAGDLRRGVADGWIEPDGPRVFAGNSVVLLLNGRDLPPVHGVEDLLQPGVRLVGCQPEVPIAYYIRQMLVRAEALGQIPPGMAARIEAAFVSRELSVKAICHKVELGAGNAGFVYGTDAAVALARNPGLVCLPLPDDWRVEVEYGIAPVSGCAHPALADAFIRMMTEGDGRAVLAAAGFTPRNEPLPANPEGKP